MPGSMSTYVDLDINWSRYKHVHQARKGCPQCYEARDILNIWRTGRVAAQDLLPIRDAVQRQDQVHVGQSMDVQPSGAAQDAVDAGARPAAGSPGLEGPGCVVEQRAGCDLAQFGS